MAGQSTYFMLKKFLREFTRKRGCDSLSDSNNAVFRNFSASEYQLNLLILIMCRYVYSLQRSTQDKGLKLSFARFLTFFSLFWVFWVFEVIFWLFFLFFFEIFFDEHTQLVIFYQTGYKYFFMINYFFCKIA
jgi:hypothetical protein